MSIPEKKERGLLLLIGGRQMPNFLTAQYLLPNVIVPIASHEAMKDAWKKIEPALKSLELNTVFPKEVDAIGLDEIKEKCQEALKEFPNVEWVFNITCATSVMSIAAYEVAKEHGASAWYLDTNTRRVATLCGKPPKANLYHVKIADYLRAYGRNIGTKGIDNASASLESLARQLALDAATTTAFQHSLGKSVQGKDALKAKNLSSKTEPLADKVRTLFYAAQTAEMLYGIQETDAGELEFILPGRESFLFLNGGWLEFYTWLIARDTKSFDDACYSLTIPADGDQKEIDLALTYAGALLIAECKTDAKPFKTTYLEKLVAVSSLIGANFVGKIFITNQTPDYSNSSIKDFFNQAESRQIIVVTGNELTNLSAILEKEVGINKQLPTYFRG
ncbi:MAG: DUF1887 family protein [Acidobacteria bacterium]|nr:DUF1887 family protein [Acidobacteriota bacterium]